MYRLIGAIVLLLLIFSGLGFYRFLQKIWLMEATHNPCNQPRFDSRIFYPNMAAAGFVGFLRRKYNKPHQGGPERYRLIIAYINQSPLSSIFLPKAPKGKIIRFLAIWGPVLYHDAWTSLYIYRFSVSFQSDYYQLPPQQFTLFLNKPDQKIELTVFREPTYKEGNKIVIYSNNWSYLPKRIQTTKDLVPQVPCWCRWQWLGIIQRPKAPVPLTGIWFDSNPILYYYNVDTVVVAWLPKTINISKGVKAVIYYANGDSKRVVFRDKTSFDFNNLAIVWGLPKEELQYCPCKRSLKKSNQ